MIKIINIKKESDFRMMCNIESEIAKQSNPLSYSPHPSHLVFDRYMFGNGADDIFKYGKLIVLGETVIGYILAYLEYTDETEFVIRLLPQFSDYYQIAIDSFIAMFPSKKAFSIIANRIDADICQALYKCRFVCMDEERWQSFLDVTDYKEQAVTWQDENIHFLSEADIDERVRYADIPTNKAITRKMYEKLMYSVYYENTLDYVIRGIEGNEFIGFITWWIDNNSKTAILEPVACLPEYRRRGITKRALFYGLNELKRREIQYAYVSTSIHNEKSQPLYRSVGFQKIGVVSRYVKEIKTY